MQHECQRELVEKLDRSRVVDGSNQLVLAWQFERAKREHPEGFTMDGYGRLYQDSAGYAVGVTPQSFANVADAIDTMARLQNTLGFRNLYLGYWRDDDGTEYVDVSMVTCSSDLAERLGRTMEQIAIYDFASQTSIRLDDTRWYAESAA